MDADMRLTPDVQKFETINGLIGATGAPTGTNLVLNGMPCKTIYVSVATGEIRYRVDGGTPGALPGEGHPVVAGISFSVYGTGACSRLQFYFVANSDLAVSFGF